MLLLLILQIITEPFIMSSLAELSSSSAEPPVISSVLSPGDTTEMYLESSSPDIHPSPSSSDIVESSSVSPGRCLLLMFVYLVYHLILWCHHLTVATCIYLISKSLPIPRSFDLVESSSVCPAEKNISLQMPLSPSTVE